MRKRSETRARTKRVEQCGMGANGGSDLSREGGSLQLMHGHPPSFASPHSMYLEVCVDLELCAGPNDGVDGVGEPLNVG